MHALGARPRKAMCCRARTGCRLVSSACAPSTLHGQPKHTLVQEGSHTEDGVGYTRGSLIAKAGTEQTGQQEPRGQLAHGSAASFGHAPTSSTLCKRARQPLPVVRWALAIGVGCPMVDALPCAAAPQEVKHPGAADPRAQCDADIKLDCVQGMNHTRPWGAHR